MVATRQAGNDFQRGCATRSTTHSQGSYRWQKAVLVAIAIPVFTNQLEKSREATDAANIRAAYAEVMAAALDDPDNDHEAEVTKKQTQADWVAELDIAGVSSNDITGGAGTITVKYTASTGKTTIDGKEVTATFMK